MTRFARFAAAVVVVLFALSGGAAYAGYPDTPKGAQADCGAGNDPLSGHYTVAVLETALKTLPTDDKEYSTCVDALESAIRADERGRTPIPGSSHYVTGHHP